MPTLLIWCDTEASDLMLLDGRWLPGCEGGVAITEDGALGACSYFGHVHAPKFMRSTGRPALRVAGSALAKYKGLSMDFVSRYRFARPGTARDARRGGRPYQL